jgi:gliding motility-associated-like protein
VTASENGCPSTPAEVTIEFEECGIIVPTAFTPDNDGFNDTWELSNIDQIYPNNMVSIYNRWGNKIYESDQGQYAQRPWNGIHKEKPLPVASYYFIIVFNDGITENSAGTVSILK